MSRQRAFVRRHSSWETLYWNTQDTCGATALAAILYPPCTVTSTEVVTGVFLSEVQQVQTNRNIPCRAAIMMISGFICSKIKWKYLGCARKTTAVNLSAPGTRALIKALVQTHNNQPWCPAWSSWSGSTSRARQAVVERGAKYRLFLYKDCCLCEEHKDFYVLLRESACFCFSTPPPLPSFPLRQLSVSRIRPLSCTNRHTQKNKQSH